MKRAKRIRESQVEATKRTYAEAYHLMTYSCTECGRSAFIWNSRNGVTPFVVDCLWCGSTHSLMHVNWRNDLMIQDHTLMEGDLYFDGKAERPVLRVYEKDKS